MACALTKGDVAATDQSRRLGRPKNSLCSHQGDVSETSRRRLQTRWQPIPPEVTGTSPRRLRSGSCRNVSSVSLVSSRSRRGRGDVSSVADKISLHGRRRNWWRRHGDLSETCWGLKKIEHVWISRDSPETQLVSRRRRGDSSHHLVTT